MPHVNGGGSGGGGGGGSSSSSSGSRCSGGGGGGGDDLASSDEIKVYKHEGEVEGDKGREALNEEKSSIVADADITEDNIKGSIQIPGQSFSSKNVCAIRPEPTTILGKPLDPLGHDRPFNMGYTCIVTPYPYPNGTATPIQVSMVSPHFGSARSLSQADVLVRARADEVAAAAALCSGPCCTTDFAAACTASKMGMVAPPHPGSPLPFMMYNGEPFAQPPPAHMGIPPVHIDPKTGMPRPSMYPIPAPGQYHPAVFSPDFAQMQWHSQSMYAITAAAGFRSPYPTTLPVSAANLPRFGPSGLLGPHPALGHHHHHHHQPPPGFNHHHHHPSIVSPGPKQDISAISVAQENHLRHSGMLEHNHKSTPNNSTESKGNNHSDSQPNNDGGHSSETKKIPHVKKPLNAFMLYMKEMRAKVVAECTLKESAAINQILGRRWHALGREEQAKYYDLARKERQLHMQLYPGWSARDNYAQQVKKKTKKRCKSSDGDFGAEFYTGLHQAPESSNPKKCRARFGLDQQSSWCKPCRRKKKCIRYVEGGDGGTTESEDNATSAGSVGEAPTPKSIIDSDHDQLNNSSEISLSSPPVPSDLERPIPCHSGSNSSIGHHHHHSQPHHHHHHHSHHHHSQTHHHHHSHTYSNNPHDSNHPLSISQLTGQCSPPVSIKREAIALSPQGPCSETSLGSAPSIVSVT